MTDGTKLRIFNMTGSIAALEPFTEQDMESMTDSNLVVFDRFLAPALAKAMREADWGFLLHPLTLEDDMGPMCGYRHSYRIPATVLRVVADVHQGTFRQAADMLMTNGGPHVYVMYRDIADEDEGLVPEDFWSLVAYQVAFLSFGRLPDSAKYTHIMNTYNSLLLSLIRSDDGMFHGTWDR